MAETYEPIATTTLSTTASTIVFSSIPGTYTDLKLIFSGLSGIASVLAAVRYNGDSGTNYSHIEMAGNGTGATSSRASSQTVGYIHDGTLTSTIPIFASVDILGYTGSRFKTHIAVGSGDTSTGGIFSTFINLWQNTNAITSITILDYASKANCFASGTTATLYGIKAA